MTKPKLDWLTFAEAACNIEQRLPEAISAEGVLVEAIELGRVSARGREVLVPKSDVDVSLVVSMSLEKYESSPFFHHRNALLTSRIRIDNNELFSPLKDGYLVTIKEGYEAFWTILLDVEIKGRDLDTYLSSDLFWPTYNQDGRPRANQKWLVLTAGLIILERQNMLQPSSFSTPGELARRLTELSADSLDERSIKQEVGVLFEAFVSIAGAAEIQHIGSETLDVDAILRAATARLKSKVGEA